VQQSVSSPPKLTLAHLLTPSKIGKVTLKFVWEMNKIQHFGVVFSAKLIYFSMPAMFVATFAQKVQKNG
jgi:hypothetical protein